MDHSDFYNRNILNYKDKLLSIEKKIRWISIGRLTNALLMILCFYFALTTNHSLFYVLIFLGIIFTALVFIHSRFFHEKELIQNLLKINEDELKALNGDVSSFDSGLVYHSAQHAYADDLDLFGPSSLFQFLNRTATTHGKELLAYTLLNPEFNKERIIARQDAVKELGSKAEFIQGLRARGLLIKESISDKETLFNWLQDPFYFLPKKSVRYFILILPAFTVGLIFYSIWMGQTNPFLWLSIIINMIYYGSQARDIQKLHSAISRKRMILENYSEVFEWIEKESFKSDILNKGSLNLQEAAAQLKRLARYVGWMDQRLNILFMPFGNFIFLFDLHCCLYIEKWKEQNNQLVTQWMQALAEFEMLSSLGNMYFNNPDFNFPILTDGKPSLEALGLAHPLIAKGKRVSNDFVLGKNHSIAIITGANMAGKSTFLRTVGINIVLAHTGAPVCASKFSLSLMNIYSSMRISDSLKDHASYFYAELNRLKTIKESLQKGIPSLILLDEILKGTNSHDKQQGSKAFVAGLLDYPCIAIMATHDLELGKLEIENPGKIQNYCFESYLTDQQLHFDYKIKNGLAQNTNALFLLKSLKII